MFIRTVLVLVLCFMTTTVFANTKQELQTAFQDLNFDLTVEWDQKDKKVLTTKLDRFKNVITGLKQKGISNEEITNALKEMINNPKLIQNLELQASLNMLGYDKSLTDFIWKNRKEMTAQGASWNGSVRTIVTASIVAIIVAAIIIVTSHLEYVCVKESQYYCEERWHCEEPGTEGEGCQESYYYDWCGTDCVDGYTVWR